MQEQLQKFIDLGFAVLPVASRGKIPLIQQWTTKASSQEETVLEWFASFPNCNWGVATGAKSGIVVVDIDPRHGGHIQWARLRNRRVVNTVTCKTGGGGFHYYFKIPENVVVQNAVLTNFPGVDIRGNGGQAIIPPSVHSSGNPYVWEKAPWNHELQELPEWLLEVINARPVYSSIGEDILPGNRNNSVFNQALMLARQGALQEFTIDAMKLWRNQNGNGSGSFSDEEIANTVESAYRRADNEKQTRSVKTVQRTDSDNADRIIDLYGEDIRYIHGYGWIVWDGKAWVPDVDNAKILNMATESMLILRDEALEEAKTPESFKTAIAKAGWAMTSLNIGRLKAAVDLASTRQKVRLEMDELDSPKTRFLLNVRNGIIDLRSGELLPHDKEALITKYIDINYMPLAECPFWKHTLELALDGNKPLIGYIQRAIGYSVTGSTSEQCFFICWGEQGNNGKSTILETLQNMLGPYAQMSDMKVITSQDQDNRVASSLAKLPGVRLVSMNEAEDTQKISEALIKQITGGDTLQACKKFKDPFEFTPIFKLWIRTNDKPIIRGMSDAIWRRIKLIPFVKPIPKEHRLRRDEVDDMLKAEIEGVLAWIVSGAIEWHRHGLQDPDDVTAATAGYRTEMDVVETFFDECIIIDTAGHIARSDLYQVFTRWAKENGLRYIMTSDSFGKRINRKIAQSERVRLRGQYVWTGVSLNDYAKNMLLM